MIVQNGYNFFINSSQNSSVNLSGVGTLEYRLYWTTYFSLFVWLFVDHIFQGINLFYLGYQIGKQRVVQNPHVWKIGNTLHWTFMLLIIFYLLFFSVKFVKDLSILLIFSRRQLLVSLIFLNWLAIFQFHCFKLCFLHYI